jgi:uncharacterized membrane protein
MTADNAFADAESPLFKAVLTPYRSLSPAGFNAVMAVFVFGSFTIGLAFWLLGAWPVVGFCGLDIALLQLAFRLNYRSARMAEEIELTRELLSVKKITASGFAVETGFNPYWARLEVDRHPEVGVTALRIASHGRRLDIARFLGPRERETFAAALAAALAKVRMAAG